MLVAVYGTLKRGYSNNRLLSGPNCEYVRDIVVQGYKLYNSGFPVAAPSPRHSIRAELWEIDDPDNNPIAKETLRRLDSLEGEGSMYNRVFIHQPDENAIHTNFYMYVGHPNFWPFERMKEQPVDAEGIYYWQRDY